MALMTARNARSTWLSNTLRDAYARIEQALEEIRAVHSRIGQAPDNPLAIIKANLVDDVEKLDDVMADLRIYVDMIEVHGDPS